MSALSATTLANLNAQYALEKRNQLIYEALASACDFQGLTGSASFLRKQADGEGDHAKAVYGYINDRNEAAKVDLIQLPEIPSDFFDIFDLVLEVEKATTDKLKTLAVDASREGDLQTFFWSSDLIREQTEEENVARTILDRFASCGSDAAMIHHLDLWIGGL